jgi:hypothetical protein
MMDSTPGKINAQPSLPSTAGVKRPAPTLLPAIDFEPYSSPAFPRPSKRQARSSPSERENAYSKYPTPIPSSTTGIISSSPPQIAARPGLQRTQSSVSERAPLSAVRRIRLSENGEPLRMGRSSNSSHYQLSANRLISRVHAEARYIAATVPPEPNKVEITCKGWNGLKLHSQGKTWELAKDDTFTSKTENVDIMLDVQDARVLLAWPLRTRKLSAGDQTDSSWDDENSPKSRPAISASAELSMQFLRHHRVGSPVSPTPARPGNSVNDLRKLFAADIKPAVEPVVVKIYEDAPSPDDNEKEIAVGESMVSTQAASSFPAPVESQSSDLSEPEDNLEEDPDEENDPIVHSFGPFGADISSRMASFTHGASPAAARAQQEVAASPKARSSSESTRQADPVPIVNHVVNQLAFSRLSSTPLSVIMNHLPADLKGGSPRDQENKGLTNEELRKLLNATACIGEIHREGKDAAGKPLESEFYYVPEKDDDTERRAAVVDGLRKPSLRNCRKQHKVCVSRT